MKAIKKINVGEGKLVLYKKDNKFTLMFEYKEDKNNLIFCSVYGEVIKDILSTLKITDQREDAVQFCFNLDKGIWTYCEYDYKEESLKEDTIDISKLSEEERIEAVNGFYNSIEEVIEIYGKDSDQIIVECYFENQ